MDLSFMMSPRYQRRVQKREAVPVYGGDRAPEIDDIVKEYAHEQASKEEYGANRAQGIELANREAQLRDEGLALDTQRVGQGQKRIDLRKKALDYDKELSRQRIDLSRDIFDTQKKENRWAVPIGVANIAIEGAGAAMRISDAEKNAQIQQEMANTFTELLEMEKDRLRKLRGY